MMLQVGDDGVVSSVNEEDLIYVDKNELEQFIESYKELEKENEQLKNRLNELLNDNTKQKKVLNNCMKENKELKQQKPFLKIIDDYFIKYGDDGELFSMHKPSNIRSLMHILNRKHGYNELQCEYNDKDMK